MDVIAHQPVSEDRHVVAPAVILQPCPVSFTIFIAKKDLLTPIATLRDVVRNTGKYRSGKARHAYGIALHKGSRPFYSDLAHIGVRVHDLERSVRFYALLGFRKTAGPIGPERVAILDHPSGVELNLVLNAPNAIEPNILMDVAEKHPGITHLALLCSDIMAAKERLEVAGFPLSGGPVRFGPRAEGIFVRDPDRNVIELHQRG